MLKARRGSARQVRQCCARQKRRASAALCFARLRDILPPAASRQKLISRFNETSHNPGCSSPATLSREYYHVETLRRIKQREALPEQNAHRSSQKGGRFRAARVF